MSRRAASQAGFTLMEITAALAILGMSLFILLQSHYSALNLYEITTREVHMRELLERAMGMAEAQVMGGELSGEGDFGARYGDDYSWRYEAVHAGEDDLVQLYEVNVAVRGPGGSERLKSFLLYNPGLEVLGGGQS